MYREARGRGLAYGALTGLEERWKEEKMPARRQRYKKGEDRKTEGPKDRGRKCPINTDQCHIQLSVTSNQFSVVRKNMLKLRVSMPPHEALKNEERGKGEG